MTPSKKPFFVSHRLVRAVVALAVALVCTPAEAAPKPSDLFGLWRVMDGKSPEPISLVAISEKEGVVQGTVMRVMHSNQGSNPVCLACKGDLKDKPVIGMNILWGLKQDHDKAVWSGGSVLDPGIGQIYKCKLTLKDENTLEVRGYLGVSLIGRSQMWKRAQPEELTAPAAGK